MDSNQKSHDKGLKPLKGALHTVLLDLPKGTGEASIVAGEDFALETTRQWQAYTNFPTSYQVRNRG